MAWTLAAVALGSNLGPRTSHLAFATEQLEELLDDVRVSSFRETDPVGVEPQPRFLNAAVVGATRLEPAALLDRLLSIEHARHRERPFPGAPRTLDLDLILHGASMLSTPSLCVPHPRFRERRFVLEPLAEIAPELVDPVTRKTIGELWADLRATEHR